jgi:hypothetical protein
VIWHLLNFTRPAQGFHTVDPKYSVLQLQEYSWNLRLLLSAVPFKPLLQWRLWVFSAASIDRNALEQLRSEQMRLAESISRRMLAQMADAAEVLTPAQRTKLAERMKSHAEGGRWGRGGHHGGGWLR